MKRLPTYLEPEEVERLLAVAPPRHRLCFLLWARAGLRVSESVKVRHEDIIWREGQPTILRLIGKGDKEALLPIARLLRIALMEVSDPQRTGWLFPGYKTHVCGRQARYWLVRACERAGIAQVKAHPHALRHSFATHLLRGNVNLREVQGLMRHSNIRTTSLYLHTNPERLQDAIDTIDATALPKTEPHQNGHRDAEEELRLLSELERITRRKLELLQARPAGATGGTSAYPHRTAKSGP